MKMRRADGPRVSTSAAAALAAGAGGGGGSSGVGAFGVLSEAQQRLAPVALFLVCVMLVATRWATSGARECGAAATATASVSAAAASAAAAAARLRGSGASGAVVWDPQAAAALATPRPQIRDKFTRIYSTSEWGRDGGGSGTGSTLSHTTTTRVVLEMLIFRHGVMRLLDAPCGSAHWWPPLLRRLQAFQPGFSYTGVDVVESVVAGNRKLFADEFPEASFYSADLSQAALPVSEFDMALCRDALQHLPLEVAVDVIANIARAKPRFAAFGSYIENNVDRGNAEIRVGEYYLINLRLAPFNMTGTVDVLNENSPNSRERKYLLLYSNEYLQSLDFEAMKARAREGAAAFKSKARRAQVVVQRGGQRGLLDGGLLEAMT